ncbi:hypothetical protein D5086_022089 [Populus alba]|uniref:Uncharacterized protein n=1 Tax=Populus alba TaxID=43335 RepID=A0ACC4BEL2_POPAL
MENSMSCKPFSSSSNEKTTDDSFEESGWTMYFEDFFAQNNREDCDHDFNEHSSFSFDHDGSSPMVSDAASLAVMKSAGDHHGERVVGLPIDNKSFKKRRTKGALLDDALEDTASSPVNSPKDKGSASGQIDMRSDLGFILRESDSTELQKRGLCLVPLSMAVNYLG